MKTAEDNEFVDVKGFEGWYKIRRDGTVISVDRVPNYRDKRNRVHKGKVLKPWISDTGYWNIGLTRNRKQTTIHLHKLVALHFVPNPNNLPVVMHMDSNKLNPHANNLKWGTHSINMSQSFEEGRIPVFGYKHPLAKYSKEQYESIWSLFEHGHGSTFVSKEMNIPLRTVQKMKEKWEKYIHQKQT